MQFDDNLLKELNINKEGADKEAFLNYLQETLEERVGVALYDLLDDKDAEEFMELNATGDDEAAQKWLETHLPDYKDVVQDEYDILIGEIAENAAVV